MRSKFSAKSIDRSNFQIFKFSAKIKQFKKKIHSPDFPTLLKLEPWISSNVALKMSRSRIIELCHLNNDVVELIACVVSFILESVQDSTS